MDGYDLAARVLPLDGPYEPEAVVAAAGLVTELVRRLNRATGSTHALPRPGDVYGVLGGITQATAGLDQLLDQLAGRLEHLAHDGRLVHERHPDKPAEAAAAATEAGERLRLANAACAELYRHLCAAWARTSPLAYHPED